LACEGHAFFSDTEFKKAGYRIFKSKFKGIEDIWTAKARFRPSHVTNIKSVSRSWVDTVEKAYNKFTARKHNIPRWDNQGSNWVAHRSDKETQILECCEKLGIPSRLLIS